MGDVARSRPRVVPPRPCFARSRPREREIEILFGILMIYIYICKNIYIYIYMGCQRLLGVPQDTRDMYTYKYIYKYISIVLSGTMNEIS